MDITINLAKSHVKKTEQILNLFKCQKKNSQKITVFFSKEKKIYSSWAFKIYLTCGLFLNNHKGNDVETYSYK